MVNSPRGTSQSRRVYGVSRLSGDGTHFSGHQSKGVSLRLFPQPLSKMPLRFHSSDIRSVSCLAEAARHAASGVTGQKGSASFSRVSNSPFVTTEVERDPVFPKRRHLHNFLTPLNLSEWAESAAVQTVPIPLPLSILQASGIAAGHACVKKKVSAETSPTAVGSLIAV